MKGVTADVTLKSGRFSNEDEASEESPSKILVAKETAQLRALHKRLSVRDLATQFETGQAAALQAAAKLAEEKATPPQATKRRSHCTHAHHAHHAHHGHHAHPAPASKGPGDGPPALRSSLRRTSGNLRECERNKVKEVVLLDRPALLKKLRALLGELAGRVAGRNKDDVTEALATVEVMDVQLTQKENELAQEKADVRKMASLFKQASDDARRMVEEARALAQAEIETARASAERVEAALEEQAHVLGIAEQEELEEMRKEVTEARRIKMLHEPSKAMDMEFEIQGLRQQLTEKAVEVIFLRKELGAARRQGQPAAQYEVQGEERLGASLIITALTESAPDLSQCTIQWHRMSADGSRAAPITGATRPQYAPEPLDIGRVLRADLTLPNGGKEALSISGPLDAAPGLGNYVEALVRKGGAEFSVKLVQQNGEIVEKPVLHVLFVDRTRIKLCKGRTTKAKETYSSMIQLCGARGGGQAAARALYWVANKGLTFMLVLESERERNAAIMLARRFAADCNVILGGPDDGSSLGTTSTSDP